MRYKRAANNDGLVPHPSFYYPTIDPLPERKFGSDWEGAKIVDASYIHSYEGEMIPIRFLLHPRWPANSYGVNDAMLMALGLHVGNPNVSSWTLDNTGIYTVEDVFNWVSINHLRISGIIPIVDLPLPVHFYLPSQDESSFVLSAPYEDEEEPYEDIFADPYDSAFI
jgi:hypothetical protein